MNKEPLDVEALGLPFSYTKEQEQDFPGPEGAETSYPVTVFFETDEDRRRFMKAMREAIKQRGLWQVGQLPTK
jgi:hypothetical protein